MSNRIVRRLNVVIALLSVLVTLVAIPYLQFLVERLPSPLLAIPAALITAGVFLLVRTYRTVQS